MKISLTNIINKLKQNPDIIFYIFLGFYFVAMILLSNFRDMIKDEALYYKETSLMAELIRNGTWIGSYGVGLHGFLFKLPPALIFLITGPSVGVVTIYNIILGIGVGFFFYKLVKTFLKNGWFAFFATAFLMTNFHFVISMPTYLREIPSLLIIVLFMWAVLKNWNKWYMSIIFVLLLDTKEYVFLVFVIVYILWLFITSKEKVFWRRLWNIIKHCFIVFLPSVIWVVLMFLTNIIPVNMYLASTVGLIQNSLQYTIKHFETGLTTLNLVDGGKTIQAVTSETVSATNGQISFNSILNILISYLGKILYPRTFSFLSVSKVVMFPVLYASVIVLINYLRKKVKEEKVFLFSSLLCVVWILFYILRASHGRYLLPIVPAIAIMAIYVFFFSKFTQKQRLAILIGTGIFTIAGLFFESSYILEKVILETVLFSILCVRFFKPRLKYFKYIFLTLISGAAFGVAVLFSYTQGQIGEAINWGKNREVETVANFLPKNEPYWINSYDNLNVLTTLNGETYMPVEWKWKLGEGVKDIRDLKTFGTQYGYGFDLYNLKSFKTSLESYNIKKVFFLASTLKGYPLEDQEWLRDLKACKWLQLKELVSMKGKVLYIFDVVEL